MEKIELMLEGRPQALSPAAQREGEEAWVPLEGFAPLIGCELKPIGGGRQSLCRQYPVGQYPVGEHQAGECQVDEAQEEICIPLEEADTRQIDGVLYGRLKAFAEPLSLQWHLCADNMLRVGQLEGAASPLGIGDQPPEIRLPVDGSSEVVSSNHVRGKPAVFYMWASW